MLRRGLRQPYRLVRVAVYRSCLNVSTGMRVKGSSCARAHAHAGARVSGRHPLETLRRSAFALAVGVLSVSKGRCGRDAAMRSDMRRGGGRRP